MGIFDKLKSTAQKAVVSAVQSAGNKRETFTFRALPESLAEMQALPEASLDTPFKTAALTVLALCAYAADKNIGTEMLNWLRGPRPLNGMEISFLNDRFRDGKTYLPFTYFVGSTPDNNYTPTEPYTIVPADRRAYPKSGRSLGIKYKIGSAALRTLFLQQSKCFYSPTGTEAAPKKPDRAF